MKQFYIKTYGCQMNEYDASYMSSIFLNMGFVEAPSINEADYIIINTCSVREKPQSKVYSELGRLSQLAKRKSHLKIGICGCVAELDGINIFNKFNDVAFVVGTAALWRFPTILEEVESGKRVIDIEFSDKNPIFENYRPKGVKAYVSIMRGCDNFCSYCIVPYVRGREVSRKLSEIMDEVKNLVDCGVKEVTFLGQNVNSYGKNLDENINFPTLLSKMSCIDGLKRIRFTTSHPKDLTDELISEMANNEKICKHIHLPLQAGSDKILYLMNRGYTKAYYMQKVEKLKKAIPDIALTSDFIVGFPGETDEDFNETLRAIEEIRYSSIYSFKYSKRPLTKALELDNDVDDKIKESRLDILLKKQSAITLEINKSYEGKIVDVLVEGKSKKDSSAYSGRNSQNIVVNFSSNEVLKSGSIVDVEVIEGKKNSLFGKVKYN